MNSIEKIENIRKKNNSNWMELLKIALKYAPEETKKVLRRILEQDKKVSKELTRLLK